MYAQVTQSVCQTLLVLMCWGYSVEILERIFVRNLSLFLCLLPEFHLLDSWEKGRIKIRPTEDPRKPSIIGKRHYYVTATAIECIGHFLLLFTQPSDKLPNLLIWATMRILIVFCSLFIANIKFLANCPFWFWCVFLSLFSITNLVCHQYELGNSIESRQIFGQCWE